MKTTKTTEGTIYHVRNGIQLRIVEILPDTFVIEKLIEREQTDVNLFRTKTTIHREWKQISNQGYVLLYSIYNVNRHQSLEDAIAWVKNFNEYPKYH